MAVSRRRFNGPSEEERINKVVFGTYAVIAAVLFLAYVMEFVKGTRTLQYSLTFLGFLGIPFLANAIVYFKNKESKLVRYFVLVGYMITYVFVLFTGSTVLTFTYILPIFVAFMLYSDVALLILLNVVSLVVNLICVIREGRACGWEAGFITESEIRLISMLLIGVCGIFGAKLTAQINAQKLDRLNREKGMTTNVLHQTLEVSKGIIADIDKVNEHMGHLGESVRATRDSMEEVSAGSSDTAESVQTQLSMTENIQKHIERVEEVSGAVKDNVSEADKAITNGQQNMDKMMHQAAQSQSAAKEVSVELSELTQHVDEMQTIVEMIENVTSETSLLSLNASIEAARAGEAGRGFAVVASEISKLADQTSNATVNITELIQNIGTALKEVVEAINALVESNDLQNKYASETSKDFTAISAKTSDIARMSNNLADIIVELAQSNSAIVDSVQNISAITEEVSAHATETFDESEANLEIVEEIGALVESLTKQAKELSDE